MKKNNLLIFSLSIIFFGCATLKKNNTVKQVDINASIDLVDVNDDKVKEYYLGISSEGRKNFRDVLRQEKKN